MKPALLRVFLSPWGAIASALSVFFAVFLLAGEQVPITLVAFVFACLTVFILAKPEYGLYLLLLNALAATSSYFDIPTVGPLSLAMAIEGVLVLAFAFQISLLHKRLHLNVAENYVLAAYVGLILLSVLLADRISPISLGLLRQQVLVTVLIYFLLTNLIDTPTRLIRLVGALVVTDAILVASGLLNYAGFIKAKGIDPSRIVGRTVGLLGNPNDFAFALIGIFPLVVGLILYSRSVLARWALTVLAFGNLFVILHTLSRGGFISLCAVILFMAYRVSRDVRIVVLLLVLSLIAYLVLPAGLFERFEEMGGGLQGNTRVTLVLIGLRMALANPWLGVGFGNFLLYFAKYDIYHRGGATAPHNMYTSIASQTGFPSLILYLVILVLSFARLSRLLRVFNRRGDRFLSLLTVAVQAGLVNVLVFGLTNHIEHTYIVFVMLGMAVILDRLYVPERVPHPETRVTGEPSLSQAGVA